MSRRRRLEHSLPSSPHEGRFVALFAFEELGHEHSHLGGPLQEEQVASTTHDLEPGLRDHPGQDPAIDHRNDGVVVADEHQGVLPQAPQPWQAGPETDRVELFEVTT
jgi:hypothetical protein